LPGEGSRLIAHLMGIRLIAILSNREKSYCSKEAVEGTVKNDSGGGIGHLIHPSPEWK